MRDEKQLHERYELTIERIQMITSEESVMPEYREFFRQTARFILELNTILNRVRSKAAEDCTLEELRKENTNIYRDVLNENYKTSYANPAYAVKVLGEEAGKYLSSLYAEIRRGIAFAYEEREDYLTVSNELFIEIYNCFENESKPNFKEIKNILYWYVSDYYDIFVADRIEARLTREKCKGAEILANADLTDVRYLYQYGEYVSKDDEELAAWWDALANEDVCEKAEKMVETFLEKVDSAKEPQIVGIKYQLGTERLVRNVVRKLEDCGFQATVQSMARGVFLAGGPFKEGYFGSGIHQQFERDHLDDIALVWDKKLMERKLEVIKISLEQVKENALKYVGTIAFSENSNVKTEPSAAAITFSEKQLALNELYKEKVKNTRMVDILW